YLMSPTAFLQQPIRWLRAISDYRATHSGGPNFGYEFCVSRTSTEQRPGLDLSCWTTAYNGAEPVRSTTICRFSDAFEPYGFQRRFFYPCYGLAEATLMVTGGTIEADPVEYRASQGSLQRNRVKETSAPEESVIEFVGCGKARHDTEVIIVDPDSR